MKIKKTVKKKTVSKKTDKYYDSEEEEFLVYEIFKKPIKTIYYIRGNQAKFADKIVLEGCDGLPAGLYLNKKGYGFGKKGFFLLRCLKNNFCKKRILELIVSKNTVKSIKVNKKSVLIKLPFLDVKNLLVRLARINEDNNQELHNTVASFLSTKFPRQIKISTEDFDDYRPGEIAALLRRKQIVNKINEEDLQLLKSFFPKIFELSLKGKKKAVRTERDSLLENTKSITDKIFLDQVIKEFEENLSKKTLDESAWQSFLRDKVFRFLSNYVTSIEKQNVAISISYPDFVLVDVYGFVDIFEIKRHNTELLSYDDSHENYYWKPEVAKSISQIENYIDNIINSASEYIKTVKRKKGIDIKVIRPRGYIIAGTSSQFENDKASEDFRKLGVSLKNISFILYDELLANLKNLRSKL